MKSPRDRIKEVVKQADTHLEIFIGYMLQIHQIYQEQAERNRRNVEQGLLDPEEVKVSDYSEQDAVVQQLAEFCDLLRQNLEQYRVNMV